MQSIQMSLPCPNCSNLSASNPNSLCSICSLSAVDVYCLCEVPPLGFCSQHISNHEAKPSKDHKRICECVAKSVLTNGDRLKLAGKVAKGEHIASELRAISITDIDDAIAKLTNFSQQCIQRIQQDTHSILSELNQWKLQLEHIAFSVRFDPLRPNFVPSNGFEEWCCWGLIENPLEEGMFHCLKEEIPEVDSFVTEHLNVKEWVKVSFSLPPTTGLEPVHVFPSLRNTVSVKNVSNPLIPRHLGDSVCANCDTSISKWGNLVNRRAVLECGHKFHSENCFLEYLTKTDWRNSDNFKCPKCAQPISPAIIDSFFGRGKFASLVQVNLYCKCCGATENLVKVAGCEHFLCVEDAAKSSGAVKCPCEEDLWTGGGGWRR